MLLREIDPFIDDPRKGKPREDESIAESKPIDERSAEPGVHAGHNRRL
jgi:hypothetical protein